MTVAAECGSQGILDVDWELSFNVYKDGAKVNTEPIVISCPDGTGAHSAAARVAMAINELVRPENAGPGWTGPATAATEPFTENAIWKGSQHKARDVKIGDDLSIGDV